MPSNSSCPHYIPCTHIVEQRIPLFTVVCKHGILKKWISKVILSSLYNRRLTLKGRSLPTLLLSIRWQPPVVTEGNHLPSPVNTYRHDRDRKVGRRQFERVRWRDRVKKTDLKHLMHKRKTQGAGGRVKKKVRTLSCFFFLFYQTRYQSINYCSPIFSSLY